MRRWYWHAAREDSWSGEDSSYSLEWQEYRKLSSWGSVNRIWEHEAWWLEKREMEWDRRNRPQRISPMADMVGVPAILSCVWFVKVSGVISWSPEPDWFDYLMNALMFIMMMQVGALPAVLLSSERYYRTLDWIYKYSSIVRWLSLNLFSKRWFFWSNFALCMYVVWMTPWGCLPFEYWFWVFLMVLGWMLMLSFIEMLKG